MKNAKRSVARDACISFVRIRAINSARDKIERIVMRIAGAIVPDHKRVEIALTYIFGIGRTRARDIVRQAKISPDIRVKDLASEQANAIREIVEKQYRVEGDLRREIQGHIKRLRDIRTYRGVRHMKRLPVRGQSTKRNSRTVRGNVKKSIGSGRQRAASKT